VSEIFGESCPEIEAAIAGSFVLSFDFDMCGGGGSEANFCQEEITKYAPVIGTLSCNPTAVADPAVGGNHCVSVPVTIDFDSTESDVGTLEYELNMLVDDNGQGFMTEGDIPGKTTGVTVTRSIRIKTKGTCSLGGVGVPATCAGEYEIEYVIEFDAVHTSGDVPSIVVVGSTLELDTASVSYSTNGCPAVYYVDGCDLPIGGALSVQHGDLYNGVAAQNAYKLRKGTHPSIGSTIVLNYECESQTVQLTGGHTMTTVLGSNNATFSDGTILSGIFLGHWVRCNSGVGSDVYHEVVSVSATTMVFVEVAAVSHAYLDVEIGDFYPDPDGSSGVSTDCAASRIHSTLDIDVGEGDEAISLVDWITKIGALPVIGVTGVVLSRQLASLATDIGYIWQATFSKQPGNVNEMTCVQVGFVGNCFVSTVQDGTFLTGLFKLETSWPHEYETATPTVYQSGALKSNVRAEHLKDELESLLDADGNKVYGDLDIARSSHMPTGHARWSGGYTWMITFTSRAGNIPRLAFDAAYLVGVGVVLDISDEQSGSGDLYEGVANGQAFSVDYPMLARDGNKVSGSFALSWLGNSYNTQVLSTLNVFPVQTGGGGADQFTALSAAGIEGLLTQHVFDNQAGRVQVSRSSSPTQTIGYAYTVVFVHASVGRNVPSLVFVQADSLLFGDQSEVTVTEATSGNEIQGTFQLPFVGETTRPLFHDSSVLDMQIAIKELLSISPSEVVVSRTVDSLRTGPEDGVGGQSTQVGGYVWSVTFASSTWKDPVVTHGTSFVHLCLEIG
jgi:hypothetical protein